MYIVNKVYKEFLAQAIWSIDLYALEVVFPFSFSYKICRRNKGEGLLTNNYLEKKKKGKLKV